MIAVFYVLASYGLAFLLRSASITAGVRRWARVRNRTLDGMLECAFCTGFWCSLLVAWTLFRPDCFSAGELVLLWLMALAGAAAVYVLDVLVLLLETATAFLERDE